MRYVTCTMSLSLLLALTLPLVLFLLCCLALRACIFVELFPSIHSPTCTEIRTAHLLFESGLPAGDRDALRSATASMHDCV